MLYAAGAVILSWSIVVVYFRHVPATAFKTEAIVKFYVLAFLFMAAAFGGVMGGIFGVGFRQKIWLGCQAGFRFAAAMCLFMGLCHIGIYAFRR
jgi:predicted small integral membrane protein